MAGNRSSVRLAPVVPLVVLFLAACGGADGPAIDAPVAAKLARQADAVAAARTPCARSHAAHRLQTSTIAAINAGGIPAVYLEPLQARVNEIVTELELRCLPTPEPASTAPAPVVTVQPGSSRAGGHDRKRHGHGHGHDKGDR